MHWISISCYVFYLCYLLEGDLLGANLFRFRVNLPLQNKKHRLNANSFIMNASDIKLSRAV